MKYVALHVNGRVLFLSEKGKKKKNDSLAMVRNRASWHVCITFYNQFRCPLAQSSYQERTQFNELSERSHMCRFQVMEIDMNLSGFFSANSDSRVVAIRVFQESFPLMPQLHQSTCLHHHF